MSCQQLASVGCGADRHGNHQGTGFYEHERLLVAIRLVVVLLLLRFRETSTRTLLQRLRGPPAGLNTSHTQSCCCQFGRHRSPWP
jgi:hypothetical protein